jgi:molybdopterin molybdotransferase
MIGVDEALDRILSFVEVLPAEEQPLTAARAGPGGRRYCVLRYPSAGQHGDGRIRGAAVDTSGRRPVTQSSLTLSARWRLGTNSRATCRVARTVRITTGAPIPAGADAIVPFEETTNRSKKAPAEARRLTAKVRIFKEAHPGAEYTALG